MSTHGILSNPANRQTSTGLKITYVHIGLLYANKYILLIYFLTPPASLVGKTSVAVTVSSWVFKTSGDGWRTDGWGLLLWMSFTASILLYGWRIVRGMKCVRTVESHGNVCVSQDTTVKVWDVVTGAELRSLGGHRQTVTAVILLGAESSSHLGQCRFSVASVSSCSSIKGLLTVLRHLWLTDTKDFWPVRPVPLIPRGSLLVKCGGGRPRANRLI